MTDPRQPRSPERVRVTFAGERPDRIPVAPKIWVDLAAALTGRDLRRLLADPELAMCTIVDAAIAVGADAARALLFPARRTIARDDGIWETNRDGTVVGKIDYEGGLSTASMGSAQFQLDNPLHIAFFNFWNHAEPPVLDIADARRIAVPSRTFYEELGYGQMLRRLIAARHTEIALIGNCASPTLSFHVYFRGMEQGLIDLLENPRLAHAVMEKGVAFAIERGKFKIDTGLRILRLNDSAANMSVISPRLWRAFVFPHFKTVCDELHKYCPAVKIYCHICGNTLPILEWLVEAGLDCIGPLDPLGGISLSEARRCVGNDVVLMGGIDTQSFVRSTPRQIKDEARRCIDRCAVNGACYILGSGCVVPRTARRENLEAVVQAAAVYVQRR
jgi:hypothetical protein